MSTYTLIICFGSQSVISFLWYIQERNTFIDQSVIQLLYCFPYTDKKKKAENMPINEWWSVLYDTDNSGWIKLKDVI